MSESLSITEKKVGWKGKTKIIIAVITAVGGVCGIIAQAYYGYLGVVKDKDAQIRSRELDIQSGKDSFDRQIQELKMRLDFATIEAIKNERDKAIAERNAIFSENQELEKKVLAQDLGTQKALQLREAELNKEHKAELNRLEVVILEIRKDNERLVQSMIEQAFWNDLIQIRRNPFWVVRVLVAFLAVVLAGFILYLCVYILVWLFYFFREYFKKIYIDDEHNQETIDGKLVYSIPVFYKRIRNGGQVTFYFKGRKESIPLKAGLVVDQVYNLEIREEKINVKLEIRKRCTLVMDITFPFKLKMFEQ